MNLPNKSVSYEESVISKFTLVLKAMTANIRTADSSSTNAQKAQIQIMLTTDGRELLVPISTVANTHSPLALYNELRNSFIDIAEFVDVLDCLFVLGKIKLDIEKGVLLRVN